MIARREADDGRREARTQGVPVSTAIRARLPGSPESAPALSGVGLRTPHRGVQRRIATWSLIVLGALGRNAVLAAAAAAALAFAASAWATTSDTETPITPLGPAAEQAPARLDETAAERIAFEHPKISAWLARYPPGPTTAATFRPESGTWVVKAWSGEAGQIVQVVVEDTTGRVSEAWTGHRSRGRWRAATRARSAGKRF